jgi:hypothetical protein
MATGYGSLFAFWIGGVGFTETLPPDTPHAQLIVDGLTISTGSVTFTITTNL